MQEKNDFNCKKLIREASALEQIDFFFFKKWIMSCQTNKKLKEFISEVQIYRARTHADWMYENMMQLKEIYPINPKPKTLTDFNQVQTRRVKNDRQEDLRRLIGN